MSVKVCLSENHNERIVLSKESSYCSMKWLKWHDLLLIANKLIEKVPDSRNAKECCESFLKNKNKKIPKRIKNNYLATKKFWHFIKEHPKTSHE